MRDGSGVRHYRFTFSDTDRHGNVRIYYRRKGRPYVRLRAAPGTPQFDAEYQAAHAGAAQVAREAGVSVSRLRKRLAGKESADPEMEN